MPDAATSDQRDPLADDVLERLIWSNAQYQQTHGHYIVPLSERLLAARKEIERLRDRAVCSGCGSDVNEAGICTYPGCDDGDMIPASDLPSAVRRMREQRDEFHKELMEL